MDTPTSNWFDSGLEKVLTLVTECVNFISGNEVLQIILVGSLLPIGFYIFGKAKDSVSNE